MMLLSLIRGTLDIALKTRSDGENLDKGKLLGSHRAQAEIMARDAEQTYLVRKR